MNHRIKYLRTNANMTQKELGDKLGLSVNAISRYELGAAEPSMENLVRMSYLFGVSVDYILGVSDSPSITKGSDGPTAPGSDLDYVYIMGADGTRKKTYIPPEQLDRFRALIKAGMPELMEE